MAIVTNYSHHLGDREPLGVIRENIDRVQALTASWRPAEYERRWAPGKWTAREVLVHLAQTELALGNRARMALSTPGYAAQRFDQDRWVAREAGLPGAEAVAALVALSRMNLRLFEHLSEGDRDIAMAHPEYGSITIDWIVHLLPAHQIHHFKQLEQLEA